MKPCASASARPAHRSASSTPSPFRGPLTERGAGRLVSTSKAAATAASWSAVSGRSASEMSRSTRRHSGERTASRAMTRSSNDPVSEALGSSRRAASSSSATSGDPPDRSATSRSRLADARSPSIPSIRAASSSRSSGGMTSRRGGCGPVTIASRSADHGSYRATTSDCAVPTMTRRWSRATRARKRDDRPCRGVGAMQVLDHEDDRVPLPEPAEQTEDALERPRLAPLGGGRAAAAGRSADRVEARRQVGQQADDLGRGRAEQVGQDRVGQRPEGRTDGPHDRAVGLVDAGGPGRSPEHGHRLAQGADPGDRLVEEAGDPDPGRAVDQDGPRPTVRGVVEGRREIGERVFAPHEPRARIPGGHGGILRAASARLDPDDRRPALAPPRQHAQRAARRGVAVLHQVAADDGLPVRARARRAQGPRREQAAAADGPAHRVLQPDGRARARPVRRGRRHAARGGHRPRPAAGDRASSSSRAGRRSTKASCATCPPSATGSVRSSPTSAPRIRAGRGGSTRRGCGSMSATRWPSCRRWPAARSTSSRPIRRTTCSSR